MTWPLFTLVPTVDFFVRRNTVEILLKFSKSFLGFPTVSPHANLTIPQLPPLWPPQLHLQDIKTVVHLRNAEGEVVSNKQIGHFLFSFFFSFVLTASPPLLQALTMMIPLSLANMSGGSVVINVSFIKSPLPWQPHPRMHESLFSFFIIFCSPNPSSIYHPMASLP
jgi:hypothetical protein